MRVLIYGDDAEIQKREREAGNKASLRNPDLRYFNEKDPEPCNKVITNCPVIAKAYEGKAEVERPFMTEGVTYTEEDAIAQNDGSNRSRKTKHSKKAVNT